MFFLSVFYVYIHIYIYVCISPNTCSACKFFSPVTTPSLTEHISRQSAGTEGHADLRGLRPEAPAGAGPPQRRGAHPAGRGVPRQGSASQAGGRDSRGAGGQPGRTSLRTGSLCHAKPPPRSHSPPQGSGRSCRALPGSAGRALAEPSPRGGRAAAPAPLPPAGTGRPQPRARARWEPARLWERLAAGRICGVPQFPLYSALPACRSLSPFQPL